MQYSWYTNKVDKKSPETIHQILAFGSLDDIKSLKQSLGEETLTELFLRSPQKIYTASTLNFIAKFILHIHSSIDEQRYLKNTPRYTR
jgi:hypothetical protein